MRGCNRRSPTCRESWRKGLRLRFPKAAAGAGFWITGHWSKLGERMPIHESPIACFQKLLQCLYESGSSAAAPNFFLAASLRNDLRIGLLDASSAAPELSLPTLSLLCGDSVACRTAVGFLVLLRTSFFFEYFEPSKLEVDR